MKYCEVVLRFRKLIIERISKPISFIHTVHFTYLSCTSMSTLEECCLIGVDSQLETTPLVLLPPPLSIVVDEGEIHIQLLTSCTLN